jgi:IS30 family transposase
LVKRAVFPGAFPITQHFGHKYQWLFKVFKTITADNGSEFLDSGASKAALGGEASYYAHPYSSWERGSNENGNRSLRRFIPKETDLGQLSDEELQRIEDWVNNYPRRIHGYKTANEMTVA